MKMLPAPLICNAEYAIIYAGIKVSYVYKRQHITTRLLVQSQTKNTKYRISKEMKTSKHKDWVIN